MNSQNVIRYKTISQFHESRKLPRPEHPLISIVNVQDLAHFNEPVNMILDYYSVSLKRNFNGKFKYGQQEYDFDEGLMYFIAPNQVFKVEHSRDEMAKQTGWLLLIHPDFLWNTALSKNIKQFGYFDYTVNEALFLSEKEEAVIENIINNIQQEYYTNIDKFSHSIIISQIETLLNYAERFYQRQFITRSIAGSKILERLEDVLENYFNSNSVQQSGLPTVQYIAGLLSISPNYLSNLLKVLTGQSTQQHIHDKLIQKAKEKLSVTGLSVSEVAYELGFGHTQSFSKFFKAKTSLSPLQFRKSFN